MNVVELYTLAKWVVRELIESDLLDKYSNLHAILQQNAHQSSVAFEEPKNDLIESIKRVDLTTLTKDQVAFLNQIGILQAIGKQSEQQIENILFRNRLDITTVVKKFQVIIDDLNNGIGKMNFLREGLEGCIQDDIDEYGDEGLMRISFLGDASISNVADFKEWGDIWYRIGYGIALANNGTAEDIKIVGASKGSVILELVTDPKILATIGGIMLLALEVTEKIAHIRVAAAKIRSIDSKDKELKKSAADLEKRATESKETGTTNIVKLQVKELNLKDNNETSGKLKVSITDLVNFLDKGGSIELIAPEKQEALDSEEENQIDDKFAKIREINTNIRVLENRIKLIERKNSNEGEGEEGDADANEKDEPPE